MMLMEIKLSNTKFKFMLNQIHQADSARLTEVPWVPGTDRGPALVIRGLV